MDIQIQWQVIGEVWSLVLTFFIAAAPLFALAAGLVLFLTLMVERITK